MSAGSEAPEWLRSSGGSPAPTTALTPTGTVPSSVRRWNAGSGPWRPCWISERAFFYENGLLLSENVIR